MCLSQLRLKNAYCKIMKQRWTLNRYKMNIDILHLLHFIFLLLLRFVSFISRNKMVKHTQIICRQSADELFECV